MKEERSVPQRFNEKCFYYDKFGHRVMELPEEERWQER